MHTDNSPRAAVGSAGIAIYMAVFRILHNRIKKNSKNPILLLTSEILACIIILTDSTGGDKKGKGEKNLKKDEKSLDKRPVIWYTNKAVRMHSGSSLKIEQQDKQRLRKFF